MITFIQKMLQFKMTFDTLQKSRLICKILTNAGLWTNDELQQRKIPPIVYRLLIHIPLTFVYTALMWLDVVLSTNLAHATDVLYIALTETALVIKIISVCKHGALAKSIFNEWQENDMFKLKTWQEQLMWQGTFKVFGWVSFFYITCSLSVVACTFTGALFSSTYQLPFPYWTPFNWEHPIYYWYAYFYDLLAMCLTCISNCSLDMFHCYLMQHLALCFKLIAMRLENLGKKTLETNRQISQTLVEIIKFEQNVKRMFKQCESVVSYPILAQILLSAFVLCFSLYRLQNVNFLEEPGNFSALVQYAVVMTLQIFLPCYYANKVTVESDRLSNCIYNCNWTEMSPYNRRLIFLYMQYLQRPAVLRAGAFFDVGLAVFTKTMNNAYSIFALLLNMNVE